MTTHWTATSQLIMVLAVFFMALCLYVGQSRAGCPKYKKNYVQFRSVLKWKVCGGYDSVNPSLICPVRLSTLTKRNEQAFCWWAGEKPLLEGSEFSLENVTRGQYKSIEATLADSPYLTLCEFNIDFNVPYKSEGCSQPPTSHRLYIKPELSSILVNEGDSINENVATVYDQSDLNLSLFARDYDHLTIFVNSNNILFQHSSHPTSKIWLHRRNVSMASEGVLTILAIAHDGPAKEKQSYGGLLQIPIIVKAKNKTTPEDQPKHKGSGISVGAVAAICSIIFVLGVFVLGILGYSYKTDRCCWKRKKRRGNEELEVDDGAAAAFRDLRVSDEMITDIAERITDWQKFTRYLPRNGSGSPLAFSINDSRLDRVRLEQDSVERVRNLLWMWREMSPLNNRGALFDVFCKMDHRGAAHDILLRRGTSPEDETAA